MIKKMTNKDEKFYQYMGKFFGSRLVERQTNDRIYDDEDKEWYIYLEKSKVLAFVSIERHVIKNIYATKELYLEKLLNEITKEEKIENSIVTKLYKDSYIKCGFKINEDNNYKNFVMIYTQNESKTQAKELATV